MRKILCTIFISCALITFSFSAKAQYDTLHSFTGFDGDDPYSSLLLSGSKFYGVTYFGGYNSLDPGCVFSMDTNGNNYKVLHFFTGAPQGGNPWCCLIISGKKLYGTASTGGIGSGTVFSIDTDGNNYKDILIFNNSNGSSPESGVLLFGSRLFGVTPDGGIHRKGNIYSLDTNGTGYRDVYDFDTNGSIPGGPLVISGTTLYGIANAGGVYNGGCIFSVDSSGKKYVDLFDFNSQTGEYPVGGPALYHGKLYGVTGHNNVNSPGDLFSIDTNGNGFHDLLNFDAIGGVYPSGGLTFSGKIVYATTQRGGIYGNGMLLSVDTDGTRANDWFDFNFSTGSIPTGGLVLSGLNLYGMNLESGKNGFGNIFEFAINPLLGGIAKSSDSICPGDSALLIAPGENGVSYSWSPGGATTDSIYVKPLGTTDYTVTIAKGLNHYRDSTFITVVPYPVIGITGQSQVCQGQTDVLVVGGGAAAYKWSNGQTSTIYVMANLYHDTVIYVNGYNLLGCSVSDTFKITVDNQTPPIIKLSVSPSYSVCVGQCVSLAAHVTGAGPYTYSWTPPGNTTDSITVCPDTSTTYSMKITSASGCKLDTITSLRIYVDSCLGIPGIQNLPQFVCSPNPSNGVYTFLATNIAGKYKIDIYNIMGEQVYDSPYNLKFTHQINLGSQPQGVYLYRVVDENNNLLAGGKLILEK